MAKEIKNKVIVITGGAEGIGYEIADHYLAKQAKTVALLDINDKLGPEAAEKLNTKYGNSKAVFLKCDVTTDLDNVFKKLIEKFGKIDVLVNNAGIFNDKLPKKTIEINVIALIEWSLKFVELVRKDKGGNGGTIINIASIYGFRADQFAPLNHASKFAVMGFTKSFGHEYNYNKTGVRVLVLCPGFTVSSLTNHLSLWDDSADKDIEEYIEKQAWQKADVVGEAAAEVFERADSGTAWIIEGATPVAEVLLSYDTR